MTKPFSVNELIARIKANLRRNTSEESLKDKIVCGQIELNIVSRDITFKNEKLKLMLNHKEEMLVQKDEQIEALKNLVAVLQATK